MPNTNPRQAKKTSTGQPFCVDRMPYPAFSPGSPPFFVASEAQFANSAEQQLPGRKRWQEYTSAGEEAAANLQDKKQAQNATPGEPETARVYQEFLKTFQPEDPTAEKAFVRGGLMNAGSGQTAYENNKAHESLDGVTLPLSSHPSTPRLPSLLKDVNGGSSRPCGLLFMKPIAAYLHRDASLAAFSFHAYALGGVAKGLSVRRKAGASGVRCPLYSRIDLLPTQGVCFFASPDPQESAHAVDVCCCSLALHLGIAVEIKKRQELQGQKRRLYERLNLSRTEEERCALRYQIAALEITEEFLCQQFGKHGVITSVKIMYPRTEEEKRRNRNCGFVSFETRPQAESAKNSLDGKSFYGMVIRIGWGKALRPSFGSTPSGHSAGGFSDSPFPSTGFSPPPAASFSVETPAATPTPAPPPEAELVEVQVPKDRKLKMVIDLLAKYVAEEGHVFEQQVMEKFPPESGRLNFIYEKDSPDSIYYRWRVYAFGQGDTLRAWRLEPFFIYSGGRRWAAPPEKYFQQPAKKKVEAAEERSLRAAARGGERLSAADREELEELLRNITRDRASVCAAMTFCMSHGNCSAEVCSCLTQSLTLPDTALTMRLARTYLLSDLLANSSAQTTHAWTYRHHLEKSLPFIAESWSKVLEDLRMGVGVGGGSPRTQQEQWQGLERALYKMTKLWEAWGVFPPTFLRVRTSQRSAPCLLFLMLLLTVIDLTNPKVDGQPLSENLRPLVAQFPLWLRPAAMEWLLLDRYQLDKLCQQRGLGVLPSRSSSSSSNERRQKQLVQLAQQELYWRLKQEAAEVPLDVLLEAQAAAAAERQAAAAAVVASAAAPQDAVVAPAAEEDPAGAADEGVKQPEEDQQQGDVASEASDIFVFEREEEEQQQEDEDGTAAAAATAAESQQARESDRERMRAIELKVTELQVQLENQGVSKDEISSRCDALRQTLLEEHQAAEEAAQRKAAKTRERSRSPHSHRKKSKASSHVSKA
ncbi:RRM domain-containing protein [Cyclospora cayetanensis]|uniref:RRM domain-containing protein n=1 Tax=Cyclospora cayetanensis TaxID=88456 RepID=A0A1D3D2R6_9EIME|nr:RRM domain-containing protein [Cyclospora cayetanensis]